MRSRKRGNSSGLNHVPVRFPPSRYGVSTLQPTGFLFLTLERSQDPERQNENVEQRSGKQADG